MPFRVVEKKNRILFFDPNQFTHAASYQAWYACINALLGRVVKFKVDYTVIPWGPSRILKWRM